MVRRIAAAWVVRGWREVLIFCLSCTGKGRFGRTGDRGDRPFPRHSATTYSASSGSLIRASEEGREALPSDVRGWLRVLEAAGKSDTEDYPDSVRHRLIYVLSVRTWPSGAQETQVRLLSVRLRNDGSFSGSVSS